MASSRNLAALLTAKENAIYDGGDAWYEHAWKYPVAVVGDLGQTVVNSVATLYNLAVPESIEADYIDKYAFMANDIATYAKENEGAVQLGSFMAGAILPGLGISKAMSLARSGSAVFGYTYRGIGLAGFNNKIKAATQTAAKVAANEGVKSTAYRQAINSGKLWTGAEAVAENVLYEASLMAVMNKHSYFDEGWNPTFAVGAIAAGSAITGYLKWARIGKEMRAGAATTAQADQIDLITGTAGRNPYKSVPAVLREEYGEGTLLEVTKDKLADLKRAEEMLTANRLQGTNVADPLYGQRMFDTLRTTRQQAEAEALDSMLAMSPEAYRAGIKGSNDRLAWELAPRTEPLDTLASQAIDPERFRYARPEPARLAYNYLMTQRGQGTGITKLQAGLPAHVLEVEHSPYPTLANGNIAVTVDDTFHQLVELGTGSRVLRQLDQATGVASYAAPDKLNKLDKLAKYHYDAQTNTGIFDLSGIRGTVPRMAYLAYKIQEKGLKNVQVTAGGKQRWLFDSLYRTAAQRALTRFSPETLSSIAEARTKVPGMLTPYQTVSWWDGKPLMQDSIEAHMTRRAYDATSGQISKLGVTEEGLAWQRTHSMGAAQFKQPWEHIETVGRTLRPIPTARADAAFIRAGLGAQRLGATALKELPIGKTDLPRLQAAYASGHHVVDFPTQTALFEHVANLKLVQMRDMLKAADLSPIELSVRLNMPVETVKLAMTGFSRDITMPLDRIRAQYIKTRNPADWMVYGASTSYTDAFKPATTALLGRAQHKLSGAQIAARLDREAIDDMALELVDNISAVAASKSPLVADLYANTVRTPAMEAVRQLSSQLANDASMGTLFASADFTMRHYDQLVAPLTQAGKQLETAQNAAIKRFEKAIAPTANALVKSETDVVNYEYVKNALASLGSKDFDRFNGLVFEDGTNKLILRPAKEARGSQAARSAEYLKYPDGSDIVVTDLVRRHMEATELGAKEIFDVRDAVRQLYGRAAIVDRRNFWFPSPSLEHAAQAFVWDKRVGNGDGKITRIIGNNLEELNEQVAKVRTDYAKEIADGQVTVHMRNDTELGTWLRVRGLAELENAINPIPTMKRAGIASDKVTGNPAVVDDVIRSFRNEYVGVARQYVRAANADIIQALDNIEAQHMSTFNAANRKSILAQGQRWVSPATVAKATLLNTSVRETSAPVRWIDDTFSLALDTASQAVRQGYLQYQKSAKRGIFNEAAFKHVTDGLRANGIPVPWKDQIEFAIANTPELKPVAKDIVAAHNSVVATLALRLGELAHPLVNTLTAPMVITGELMNGGSRAGTGFTKSMATMYKGSRDWAKYAFSPAGTYPEIERILQTGKALGHTQLRVSEATQTLATGFGSRNWWQKMESTGTFKFLCATSDFSERAVREISYLTGYRQAAAAAGPGVAKEFLHTQAALFTDRAMGNYTARQRPIFFQGAAGQAIGLFQTFMYTMGQNLFRYAENQNMRAIAGTLGGYGVMFGASSLPGFQFVDTAIGQFSKDEPGGGDRDASQILYEAFGDRIDGHAGSVAEYLLYGLPSTLLQTSLWTRGELQPRLPVNTGGLPLPPAINMYANTFGVAIDTAKKIRNILATSEDGVGNALLDSGRAAMEGVAMQYAWRPAARLAEVSLGYSIDRKSETVLSGEDVRGPWAVFSRVLGSRPLKEQVIRNYNFRHRLYDSADQRRRSTLTQALRTQVRGDANVTGLMGKYIEDGGSVEGWRQALNDAHFTANAPAAAALLREVSKQPGIAAIMEGYAF